MKAEVYVSLQPRLTALQEQVLSLISAGCTVTSAAASAGVHRNTVGNWLRSPAFRHSLELAHCYQALFWREKAESIAAEAFEVLRGILADSSAPASVRLKAALVVLDKAAAPLPAVPSEYADPETGSDSTPPPREAPEPLHRNAQFRRPVAPVHRPGIPVARHADPKTGRNEACPCGSGRKFKRCCLDKPRPQPASAPAA
jgi:hypothetical protein